MAHRDSDGRVNVSFGEVVEGFARRDAKAADELTNLRAIAKAAVELLDEAYRTHFEAIASYPSIADWGAVIEEKKRLLLDACRRAGYLTEKDRQALG